MFLESENSSTNFRLKITSLHMFGSTKLLQYVCYVLGGKKEKVWYTCASGICTQNTSIAP